MKKNVRRFLAILLSALLTLGCAVPAFATVRILLDDEKADMVSFFNDSVNIIKTEMPKAKITYKNYVPEGGMTTNGTDELDETAKSYLIPILEGMFNNNSSVAKSLVRTLVGTPGTEVTELDLHRDLLRNNSVPVYGETYVSALTPAEDYDLIVDMEDKDETPKQLAITFHDTSLENAKETSIGKAFYLPSGSFDPMLISGARTEAVSRLDNAKFQRFDIKNAKLVAKYDSDGVINYYGSTIDYNFSITFYDCMNLISAVLGYDFYSAALKTVNMVLENLGKSSLEAAEILQDREILVTYRCTVEITGFNFTPRLFGDINDDGYVTAGDARLALRHAVDLEKINFSGDRIYADVNFDGEINAADARDIMRLAVGLDTLFDKVPEGQKIKIVKIEEDIEDDDDDDDENPLVGPDGKPLPFVGLFDQYDPAIKLTDIVEAVFKYIGMVENTEGDARNYIQEFIDAITKAVGENENP